MNNRDFMTHSPSAHWYQLKKNAPRLLPLLGALLVVAGIIGLTLVQHATQQRESFDDRSDASVASGSVHIRARKILLDESIENTHPHVGTPVSIVFEIDTNGRKIDGMQLAAQLRGPANGLIDAEVIPQPQAGLTTLKSEVSPSSRTGSGLEFRHLSAITDPNQSFSSQEFVPFAVIRFIPQAPGEYRVHFPPGENMVSSYAGDHFSQAPGSEPPPVFVDILQHIEEPVFTVDPIPPATSDDLYWNLTEGAIDFIEVASGRSLVNDPLVAGRRYLLVIKGRVNNTNKLTRDTTPVITTVSFDGSVIATQSVPISRIAEQPNGVPLNTVSFEFTAKQLHLIELWIDPENTFTESDEANNLVAFEFAANEPLIPVPSATPTPTPTATPYPTPGTGGISPCTAPTHIEVDALSCANRDQMTYGLKWKRPEGAKHFEVWLSQDPNFNTVNKKITTRHSEWWLDHTVNDGQWYVRIRVSDSTASCRNPGNWREVQFNVDCTNPTTGQIRSCNDICTANNECPVNHSCRQTEDGSKRCRLAIAPESPSCRSDFSFADNTRSCNQSCYENADCSTGLSCWYNSCRLPSNLMSPTCSTTGSTTGVVGRSCNEACTRNSECAPNLMCHHGACRYVLNPGSPICAEPSDATPKGSVASDTTEEAKKTANKGSDTAEGTESASLNDTTDASRAAVRPKPLANDQDTTGTTDTTTEPFIPVDPPTQPARRGFFDWLRGVLGISQRDSFTDGDTPDTAADTIVTDPTESETLSPSQERPVLAVALLGIGIGLLFLIALWSIVRSVLGMGRPRGVVRSSGSGSSSSGSGNSAGSRTTSTAQPVTTPGTRPLTPTQERLATSATPKTSETLRPSAPAIQTRTVAPPATRSATSATSPSPAPTSKPTAPVTRTTSDATSAPKSGTSPMLAKLKQRNVKLPS